MTAAEGPSGAPAQRRAGTVRTLTLRIYLTVVAVLALFAGASGWVFQSHMREERAHAERALADRMVAWGDLLQRSLPAASQPAAVQSRALDDWANRLKLPLALDDASGQRIAASLSYRIREGNPFGPGLSVRLGDGRRLWIMRPGVRPGGGVDTSDTGAPPRVDVDNGFTWDKVSAETRSVGVLLVLATLFVAVAGSAWPVVNRLTRRLDALKTGVRLFGAGNLGHRVEVGGNDELAEVAASFNEAADRIEALVRAHKSLLANASHELRSPLARMRVAVSLIGEADAQERAQLQEEIDIDIAELDALVEEVLLASQLDAQALERHEAVDVLALAAEEAARVGADLDGQPAQVQGDERLVRRALRNLLENAERYGGGDIGVTTRMEGGEAVVRVADRGPGVPEGLRERIFEPFYRLPGHAEQAGGVGLGLSLVRQIAEQHRGSVQCVPREGGGSCFVLRLPA